MHFQITHRRKKTGKENNMDWMWPQLRTKVNYGLFQYWRWKTVGQRPSPCWHEIPKSRRRGESNHILRSCALCTTLLCLLKEQEEVQWKKKLWNKEWFVNKCVVVFCFFFNSSAHHTQNIQLYPIIWKLCLLELYKVKSNFLIIWIEALSFFFQPHKDTLLR